MHKPVFEANEEFGFTNGELNYVDTWTMPVDNLKLITVNFTMWAEGKKYTSIRNVILNTFGYTIKELLNLRKFRVKYWKNNPWRAQILLDQPLKKKELKVAFKIRYKLIGYAQD